MKILYLTMEPPFDAASVVRGNALRARQLIGSLNRSGFEVVHRWAHSDAAADSAGPAPGSYDPNATSALLDETAPDVVLIGYWTLGQDLPSEFRQPLIVDFIAPRPLEALFEDRTSRDTEMRRLLGVLERASGFIVANQRQRHLLTGYLLMAGHDLGRREPIVEVPIAALRPFPKPTRSPTHTVTFVGGGVEWPWRHHRSWLDAVADVVREHAPRARLVEFGGTYPEIGEQSDALPAPATPDESVVRVGLLSYRNYSGFLSEEAHIGLELADENVERYFSQSFRAIDYLSHGLPLICNSYLSIAEQIRTYDAGWIVDGADGLRRVVADLITDPGPWATKSANALALVRDRFDAETCIQPLGRLLLEGLEASDEPRPRGGAFRMLAAEDRSELERLRKQVGDLHERNLQLSLRFRRKQRLSPRETILELTRHVVAHLPKPAAGSPPGNVVVVTRSDLFPTDHGGAVKIVETARGLSRTDRRVGIVTNRRDLWWEYRGGERQTRRFPMWLRLISPPRGIGALSGWNDDLPQSNAFLYRPLGDSSYLWRTLYVARQLQANVYQAEFPAFAHPCMRARSIRGGHVFIVEHNVEYERLREQERTLTEAQYLQLKEIEIGLCNEADGVICVSESDLDRLSADGVSPERLHAIPHGVDLAGYDAAAARDLRATLGWPADASILVFHGTYEYRPNLEAVRICAREILPRLEQRGHSVRILAIGRGAPSETIHPNLHFTGSVDLVAEWLKGADVAVVPLLEGGGTRMKILDYFACRVPVVSTSKGVEGIPIEPGREAVVADDWDVFCRRIEELIGNPACRNQMVRTARAFVEPLDWNRLATRYVSLYEDVATRSLEESTPV